MISCRANHLIIQVQWDAAKDHALWKILSTSPKNNDTNWPALATHFDVPLAFLLQQAAFLYDRQFEQVKAQLRKVGAGAGAVTSSGKIAVDSLGGETMVRTASGGAAATPTGDRPRAQSQLPPTTGKEVTHGSELMNKLVLRATAPPLSRNSSANTTVQIHSRQASRTSPRPVQAGLKRRSISPQAAAQKPRSNTLTQGQRVVASPPSVIQSERESDSDGGTSEEELPMQSRLLRRPPLMVASSDEDESDTAPTFLLFSAMNLGGAGPRRQTSVATLRGNAHAGGRGKMSVDVGVDEEDRLDVKGKGKEVVEERERRLSDSSASSTQQAHPVSHRNRPGLIGVGISGSSGVTSQPAPDPIAHPSTAIQPARKQSQTSQGQRPGPRQGNSNNGKSSDGTPSMGSSFSDLDGTYDKQSSEDEMFVSF